MSEDTKKLPYKIKLVTKILYDNSNIKDLDNMSKFLYPNISQAIRRLYDN
jgi:hypothetical protein